MRKTPFLLIFLEVLGPDLRRVFAPNQIFRIFVAAWRAGVRTQVRWSLEGEQNCHKDLFLKIQTTTIGNWNGQIILNCIYSNLYFILCRLAKRFWIIAPVGTSHEHMIGVLLVMRTHITRRTLKKKDQARDDVSCLSLLNWGLMRRSCRSKWSQGIVWIWHDIHENTFQLEIPPMHEPTSINPSIHWLVSNGSSTLIPANSWFPDMVNWQTSVPQLADSNLILEDTRVFPPRQWPFPVHTSHIIYVWCIVVQGHVSKPLPTVCATNLPNFHRTFMSSIQITFWSQDLIHHSEFANNGDVRLPNCWMGLWIETCLYACSL